MEEIVKSKFPVLGQRFNENNRVAKDDLVKPGEWSDLCYDKWV
jgi:hypothetical protein